MTIEQLRKLHQSRPFVAFEVNLADGRTIPVTHPEALAVSNSGRTIGVAVEDDAIEIIDLLLVTSLKPRSNGSTRAKRR